MPPTLLHEGYNVGVACVEDVDPVHGHKYLALANARLLRWTPCTHRLAISVDVDITIRT